MTDSEMVVRCALAMGMQPSGFPADIRDWSYNPIASDEQAMALVKRFQITIDHRWIQHTGTLIQEARIWSHAKTFGHSDLVLGFAQSEDVNRAIVECVAKMQARQESPDCGLILWRT